MTKDVLVISDQHAHPDHNNDRADWLGQLIVDRKPDVVINIGDAADMASLSSFDKGKASFHGSSYQADIEAHLDFQDRLWAPMRKAKRKQPYRVVLHGNHEHRLQKVLEYDPQLAGSRYGVSFTDYAFKDWYHEEIPYLGSGPGTYDFGGVTFAHFLPSGAMGKPIGGVHQASSMIAKAKVPSVVGHSHFADYSVQADIRGNLIQAVVAGVYQDYNSGWAGNTQNGWWRGLVYLHGVEGGQFDPEFISLDRIKREYQDRV